MLGTHAQHNPRALPFHLPMLGDVGAHGPLLRMVRGARLPALIAFVVACAPSDAAQTGTRSGDGVRCYATIGRLEPDKVASAWLIERFVDPGARVELLDPGSAPPAGCTLFDCALASWSRDRLRSTFRVILDDRSLRDPALLRIADWLDRAECNYWSMEPDSAEARLDRLLKDCIVRGTIEEAYARLDRCFRDPGPD